MNVKIDTKEKFHIIRPLEHFLSVNMTEELHGLLLSCLKKDVNSIVLNLGEVSGMDDSVAQLLIEMQQYYYDHNASFVICEVQKIVEIWLDEKELLEIMNVTPTESEAWDIVQMEEIERELMGDE